MTLSSEIFGLPLPDAGPVFASALVIHILCGLTAVIAVRSPLPRVSDPDATRVLDGSICGRSAELSPLSPSRPLFAGTKTPTYSPSPLSRLACTATALGDATAPAGHPTMPSAWAAPHRPAHWLLRRQRTLPAPMGSATPYHLLAPASLVGVPLLWLALQRFSPPRASGRSSRQVLSDAARTRGRRKHGSPPRPGFGGRTSASCA
jgi:hypothetical protein